MVPRLLLFPGLQLIPARQTSWSLYVQVLSCELHHHWAIVGPQEQQGVDTVECKQTARRI